MLHGIVNRAVGVHHPVNTAIFPVDTVLSQKFKAVGSFIQILLFSEHKIAVGVKPKYSGMKYDPLGRILVRLKSIAYQSVKSASFIVAKGVPKGDYMIFKLLLYFRFHKCSLY